MCWCQIIWWGVLCPVVDAAFVWSLHALSSSSYPAAQGFEVDQLYPRCCTAYSNAFYLQACQPPSRMTDSRQYGWCLCRRHFVSSSMPNVELLKEQCKTPYNYYWHWEKCNISRMTKHFYPQIIVDLSWDFSYEWLGLPRNISMEKFRQSISKFSPKHISRFRRSLSKFSLH